LADWAHELLSNVAKDGRRGHLMVTFGVPGCFGDEERSWIEVRWEDHVVFVRGEHEGARLDPPVHLDRPSADRLARSLLEASEIEEPDVSSTTGANFLYEGQYQPRGRDSVHFRVELGTCLNREPSLRLARLSALFQQVASGSTGEL
jgi:hypothetical protein